MSDLKKNFQTKFVSTSYVNQSLIDKYCVTDSNGNTECNVKITGVDPTSYPSYLERPIPLIENIISFPISNGIFHAVHEQLVHSPECCTSAYSPKIDTDISLTSDINLKTSSSLSNIHKLKNNKPKYPQSKRNSCVRICYRCGDSSHKVSECNFDASTSRVDNIKLRHNKWNIRSNSLNCLPKAFYDILSDSFVNDPPKNGSVRSN